MEISILLAQQIAQLFLMIFMGFLIVKAGLLKDEDSKVLSKIVLYLIIPCVILNAFQVDYTPETVRGLLVAFAASLLMQVVLLFAVSALGRVFHLDAVEITSVYYSNSGNLIVPLVTAVLGAEWVLYSCVYMSVQLVFFWTHCKKVISREASYDWKKIVLNLNIISIFVGILLFFTGIRLPALVNNTLHSVGSMVGPASMIVTGMLFAGMDFRQIFANKRIYFVTFLRLIAVPLMALVLLKTQPSCRSFCRRTDADSDCFSRRHHAICLYSYTDVSGIRKRFTLCQCHQCCYHAGFYCDDAAFSDAASNGTLITINRKTLSRFPFQRSIDSVFYYPINTFFPSNANP